MKRTIVSASPFDRPLDLSRCPPRIHARILLVRVTAALMAIVAAWLIVRVMYALPWPADALVAAMTASAWCQWLERRESLR